MILSISVMMMTLTKFLMNSLIIGTIFTFHQSWKLYSSRKRFL